MKHLLLLLILTAALTACKKDEVPTEQLPAATTTGAGTAGCYVDGKLWVAKKSKDIDIIGSRFNTAIDGGGAAISETDSTDRNYIWMWFTDRTNGSSVSFCLDTIPKIGQTFVCNQTTCVRPACLTFINYATYSDNTGFYVTDSLAGGTITFTNSDVVPLVGYTNGQKTRLLSGNFSFTARNPSNGKTIKITDGRFDFIQQ